MIAFFADSLAGYVPFSAEQRLAARFAPKDSPDPPMQHYLQQMADRLAQAEQLPPAMHITVHYVDSDTINAFATLGGHVVFFRGLLERMPDENALAMVMAHEIAHVRNRDPLRSLGRGMVMAVILGLVDNSLGTELAGDALGQAGLLTQLSFSRQQESAADRIGQAALAASYGGVAGADELFRVLDKAEQGKEQPASELYRSHPDVAARLAALHRQAAAQGWQPGDVVPLPAAFHDWLKKGKDRDTSAECKDKTLAGTADGHTQQP